MLKELILKYAEKGVAVEELVRYTERFYSRMSVYKALRELQESGAIKIEGGYVRLAK